MKRLLLILLAGVIFLPSSFAATLTVNFNQSNFTMDPYFYGMGMGRWYAGSGLYVESNSGGSLNAINNENFTREQLLNRSVRRIRLDVNSGISTGVNTFVNSSVTSDTRIQSHIDTVRWAAQNDIEVWLLIKFPSWNTVTNAAICGGSGTDCYIADNATYRQFIQNYLNKITDNGTYVPQFVIEPTNEPDLFYWGSVTRGSDQFNQLMNHVFNETIKGATQAGYGVKFAGPSLCGGWFGACASQSQSLTIIKSILGNFSNNLSYVTSHPYPGDYATWPTDISNYIINRAENNLQLGCDYAGISNCSMVLTETGYNDNRVADLSPSMNNDPNGMYNAFAEIYRTAIYYKSGRLTIIPFQAQCYTFSRSGQCEYPKQWTIMPNPSLTNLTTGPGNFTKDIVQAHDNGAKVNNYTTDDSNVVAIATNSSGAYGLTIINRDKTATKTVTVVINGFTATNATFPSNGSTMNITGNTFTTSVGVNKTWIMYFNDNSAFNESGSTSSNGSGGPYYENFSSRTASVTVNFSWVLKPINPSAWNGINVNQNPLVPNGCIDTNDDGACDTQVNFSYYRNVTRNASLNVFRKDLRVGYIVDGLDNKHVENFDASALCANKTSGSSWSGTSPYQWKMGFDNITGSAGSVCRTAAKSSSIQGQYAAVINNTGTGNISVGQTINGQALPGNGSSYVFSVYAAVNSGSGELRLRQSNDTTVLCTVPVTSSSWTKYNCTITPPGTPATYNFTLHAAASSSISFDEMDVVQQGDTFPLHAFLTTSNNDFVNYGSAYQLAEYCWNNGNPICTSVFTIMDMPDTMANFSVGVCEGNIRNCPSQFPDEYGRVAARLAYQVCGNGTFRSCKFEFENEPDSKTYYAGNLGDTTDSQKQMRAYFLNRDYNGTYYYLKQLMPWTEMCTPGFAQSWVGGSGRLIWLSMLNNQSALGQLDCAAIHSYASNTATNLTASADSIATRINDIKTDCITATGSACKILFTEFNDNYDNAVLENGRRSFIGASSQYHVFLNNDVNVTPFWYRLAQRNRLTDVNAEYSTGTRRREIASEPRLDNILYQTYYAIADFGWAIQNTSYVVNSTTSNYSLVRASSLYGVSDEVIIITPVVDNVTVTTNVTLAGGSFTTATATNGTTYSISGNSFTAAIPAGSNGVFRLSGTLDSGVCDAYAGSPIYSILLYSVYVGNTACVVSYVRPVSTLFLG